MPLQVELVDAGGTVVDRLVKGANGQFADALPTLCGDTAP
jgi:hypothetical protein